MSARQFRLPDVGEGLEEAEVVTWHVAVGDTVTHNQVLVEIETAKSIVELPSPFEGTVLALLVPEGEAVAVGTPIISIGAGSGSTPVDEPAAGPPTDGAPTSAPNTTAAEAGSTATDDEPAPSVLVGYGPTESSGTRRRRKAPASTGNGADPSGGVAPRTAIKAKPPVRKLAKDLGIDLAAVSPSGPDHTVTRQDVLEQAENSAPPQVPTIPAAPTAQPDDARSTRIPVKGVRKAIATAMVSSAFTAPHVTEFVTVDVTRSVKLVEKLRAERAFEGSRVTMLLLVARALLAAVRDFPEINARWDGDTDEIVLQHRVNLGIAAATPRGLMVPNIKDAGSLTLPRLAEALTGLVRTARDGKSTPEDMSRGTITITNIGVFGVDAGTPILNPGEAAILCLGAVRRTPWEHKGEVALRWTTHLSLSFDHRLVDGELGSKVLARVGRILENPKWELLLS
jgi:pyruvate dehydrogenase E2 component (dihydrolipoamide acetyltransferase)